MKLLTIEGIPHCHEVDIELGHEDDTVYVGIGCCYTYVKTEELKTMIKQLSAEIDKQESD